MSRGSEASFHIAPVRRSEDLDAAIMLFRAYASSLDVSLSYQDFDAEMAAMPGKYAPPSGELLLAHGLDALPLGCVGLRSIGSGRCEMKRLYVAPGGRGMGLGRALVVDLMRIATQIGYREMVLDTLPSMAQAQALYARLGFEIIEPYYDTPIAGTLFMGRKLGS